MRLINTAAAVLIMFASSLASAADIVEDAVRRERSALADYRDRYNSGRLRTGETERLFGPVALTPDAKRRRLLELDLGVEAGMVSFRFLGDLKVGNAGLIMPSRDPETSAIQIITRYPDGSVLGTMPKGAGRSIPLLFRGVEFHPDGHMLPMSGPLIITGRHTYADGLHVKQSFVVERLEKLVTSRRVAAK